MEEKFTGREIHLIKRALAIATLAVERAAERSHPDDVCYLSSSSLTSSWRRTSVRRGSHSPANQNRRRWHERGTCGGAGAPELLSRRMSGAGDSAFSPRVELNCR
jgi:hypothetical protein